MLDLVPSMASHHALPDKLSQNRTSSNFSHIFLFRNPILLFVRDQLFQELSKGSHGCHRQSIHTALRYKDDSTMSKSQFHSKLCQDY